MKGRLWVLAIAALSIPAISTIASAGVKKKEIDAHAYERWKHIVKPLLSDDGKWVVYTLESAGGDGELVARSVQTSREIRVARGIMQATASQTRQKTQITADSRFVLFTVATLPDEQGARSGAASSGDLSLAIMRLADGKVEYVPHVDSFVLPEDSGRYVAYRAGGKSGAIEPKRWGVDLPQAEHSTTLMLRNLSTSTEVQIPDVAEFAFDKEGRYLAYTVSSPDRGRNGAYVRQLVGSRVAVLLNEPGDYRGLTFDTAGKQLAFLFESDEHDASDARYSVYYTESPRQAADCVVCGASLGNNLTIAVDRGVDFTRRGNALTFFVKPGVGKPTADNADVKFELWHWQEPHPLLQGELPRVRRRDHVLEGAEEYLAVYHIKHKRWVQLGSKANPRVLLSDDARHAVGVNPYHAPVVLTADGDEVSWNASDKIVDISLIDTLTGDARLFRRGAHPVSQQNRILCSTTPISECRFLSLSPGGRYALYFEDRRWWSVDLEKGTLADLTGVLLPEIRFDNYWVTQAPTPVSQNLAVAVEGIAGWLDDDRAVLLYGPHDIWQVDPSGATAPRNLTDGVGRRENIVFRLLEDADQSLSGTFASYSEWWRYRIRPNPIIDSAVPLLLAAADRDTMASGVWRDRIGVVAPPEKLLMMEKRVTPLPKARHADQYLLTIETFSEYPDLWTGSRFDDLTRVSDANPQQSEYSWGTAELVEFVSDFGVPLKGILYKPANFDRSRKYPMIVSVRGFGDSWALHQYHIPEPLRTAPRQAWPSAVSKGYLHFIPDVFVAAPFPGPSAVAAVIPAVQSLIDQGFVDAKRIALTGHSYGAFEVNYLITQTDLFSAAVSDSAAGVNMLSATAPFGGASFFERDLMGGSLWQRPFVYIANSSVFSAHKVKTPILMMHNDGDRWPMSQSVEFFLGLRRNGREAFLFNYLGETHGVHDYVNRLDWDRRVNSFLDHYLNDAPPADWMIGPRSSPARQPVPERHTTD